MTDASLYHAPLSAHPAADIFPMMSAEEFTALVADVREHGLREPITLSSDGRILDGRNRYRACEEAGVTPHFVTWDGADPVAFVVSLNLHRRHLNERQRAVVAGKIANLTHGQRADQTGKFTDLTPVTQQAAADLLNVSERSVRNARVVLTEGAPELVAAVERGEVAVSTAAVIASAPKSEQVEIVARGERDILAAANEIRAKKREDRREERVARIAEIAQGNAPLITNAVYPVIYADPPWRYEHAESESRAIENQYPTMTLEDICALPVTALATDDAVLFLWATSPKLAEAMRVVESWGFSYRTCMVWRKDKIGMGYYARQQHELLLIATRGAPPAPAPATRPPSVIDAPREAHSAKPSVFAELVAGMYPEWPRIELFAREPREGWARWGNQS